jgi:hypothetical protein
LNNIAVHQRPGFDDPLPVDKNPIFTSSILYRKLATLVPQNGVQAGNPAYRDANLAIGRATYRNFAPRILQNPLVLDQVAFFPYQKSLFALKTLHLSLLA